MIGLRDERELIGAEPALDVEQVRVHPGLVLQQGGDGKTTPWRSGSVMWCFTSIITSRSIICKIVMIDVRKTYYRGFMD